MLRKIIFTLYASIYLAGLLTISDFSAKFISDIYQRYFKTKTFEEIMAQSPISSTEKGGVSLEYGWIYFKSPADLEIGIAKCEDEARSAEGKFYPMRLDRGGKITDLSCREFYERLFGEGE